MRLRLGTRGSALAVTQSEHVARALRELGHDVELVRIKTGGDVERGSLTALGGIGVFAAELRHAILDGRCDFAVHSLKDLPTAAVPGLTIAAVPTRADARDALCADGRTLMELPPGATVGTGSPRRVAQLRALRPDLSYVDVRGNVGTRLARVSDGDLDAVLLAAAGLSRLEMDVIDDFLPILPAPGQGALALECRDDNDEVLAALRVLDDPATRQAVDAERAVLAGLGGGCAAPIAAHAKGSVLRAGVFSLDGKRSIEAAVTLEDGAAEKIVGQLLDAGAADVADLQATRPSRLASLHDDESLWGGDVTLAGRHVLMPRADGPLAEGLRAAGAEVTCCPVQHAVALEGTLDMDGADWVAITSPTTVTMLEARSARIPDAARIAAVGGATADALRAAGYTVDLVPEGRTTAATLAAAFPEGPGRVVVPGSALSSPVLAEGLRDKGFDVETVPIYTMQAFDDVPADVVKDWRDGAFDTVVITSGSVGEAFGALFGWRDDVSVIAFGPPSEQWLRGAGVTPSGVAETQDVQGLARAIGGHQ